MALSAKTFQSRLLSWFDEFGRKDLPWQKNKNPYRVWVSEIMLQQTQVNTVIPYFERFMDRFPDLKTLSIADEDEVLHFWTGLGYYNRARNLLKTAKMIVTDYANQFPFDLKTLEQLPGIGRSTAGAILACAFNKKATILDGNVKRVLIRLQGLQAPSNDKNMLIQLWSLAEKYTPSNRIADYTQAIMDFGATLCTRANPHCTACVFTKNCQAYQQGLTTQLPRSKLQKTLPLRKTIFLIFKSQKKVLLEKRSAKGVWAGLWSFPEVETPDKDMIHKRFPFSIQKIKPGTAFRHTFTHFHLEILPIFISVKTTAFLSDNNQIWYNLSQSQLIGLPAPVKSILENLS